MRIRLRLGLRKMQNKFKNGVNLTKASCNPSRHDPVPVFVPDKSLYYIYDIYVFIDKN